MIGLFLSAVTLGLLVWAVQMIGGAVQTRMADTPAAPPARERVFSVNVLTAEAGTQTPVLESFGEIASRRMLELRAADGGRVIGLAEGLRMADACVRAMCWCGLIPRTRRPPYSAGKAIWLMPWPKNGMRRAV